MRSAIEARLFEADVLPVRVGRFVVIDVIGRGGMGTVYRAYDPRLDRHVAVKVLHTGRGASVLRLEREAQALARLNHPNVVTIHEVGDTADGVFVAMELVDGGTLEHWCRALAPTGPKRWRKLLAFALQACDGLAAAHHAGLVHRDLKPANILVGNDERLRVADFGLAATDATRLQAVASVDDARALDRPLTDTGAIVGTVAYMAPEQLDGHADAKSDQFGLCAAFYEAFFGERPYAGQTIAAVRESFAHGPRRPASPHAPEFVVRALLRGLAPDPQERFPDVGALRHALHRGSRKRSIAAAVAVASGVIAIGGTLAAARERACAFDTSDLGEAWSDARRAEVQAAFAASPSPAAAATLERSEAKVDRAAESWVASRASSCEATRRGEPGAADRAACLDVAKATFDELTTELTRRDAELVVHAIDVTDLLADIVECDTVADGDDSARGRELVGALQRGRVAKTLMQFDEARRELTTVLDTTAEGEFPRLRADASAALTEIANLSSDDAAAVEHAMRSLDDAERTGDPDFIARRWAMLAASLDGTPGSEAQVRFMFDRARRHQARGGDELTRADLDWKEGGFYQRRDRCNDAKPLFASAAEIFAAHDAPFAATALLQLAMCQVLTETSGVGIATHERALAAAEARYGPDHPEVAVFLGTLGDAYGFALDEATAATYFERALAIQTAHPYFEPVNRAATLTALGVSRTHLSQDAQAILDFRAALEILHGLGRSSGPVVSDNWIGIASASRILGRYADALQACDEALAARNGADPILEYEVALLRAKIFVETGRRDDASAAIDLALARSREIHEHATVRSAGAAYGIGGVLTRIDRHAEALVLLEDARRVLDPSEGGWHAALRLQLARAALAGSDEAAAREHTRAGLQLLADGTKVKPDVQAGITELAEQLAVAPVTPSASPGR